MIRFLSWLLAPTCRCGHKRNAHQHYRAGTDCSGCDCPAFRWHLLADLRDRGEVAGVPEVEDIPQAAPTRSRIYMTRAATNRTLIPHERDCRDLPTFERLAALYLIPTEGNR